MTWVVLGLLAWTLWQRADVASQGFIPPGPPPGVAEAATAHPPGAIEVSPVRPTRIRVPGADVDAEVSDVGLNGDGTLEVPHDVSVAGWWAGGTMPGDVGPAVIVGHVDSRRGPGVFHRLAALQPGAEIIVEDGDGAGARFIVDHVAHHPKSGFPTDRVYGPTPLPTLRLVTCGGRFDRGTRSYRDNVIVFATLAG